MILSTDTKRPPVKPQSSGKKIDSDANPLKTTVKKNSGGENINIKQASEVAMKKISEVLNKKVEHVTSIKREGDEWHGTVEVVEEEYLPGKNLRSMNDIIGVYDITLDCGGELINWQKKKTRKRGDTVV